MNKYYDELMESVNKLRNSDAAVVVEGMKDKATLEKLDIKNIVTLNKRPIFEIKKDVADAAVPEIQSVMEKVWPGKVQMKVEVKQGSNWGELE